MTSRICVKNLPSYVTEQKLREHFSGKGEVTDAKIIRTRDGKTRQFGFVGFRTEEEAEAAAKYFHQSFFDTSRLTCELAQPIGASNLGRPWSRHSKGSSAFDKSHTPIISEDLTISGRVDKERSKHKETKSSDNIENDPQLNEFLEVMQPRNKAKLWANDTTISNAAKSETGSKLGRLEKQRGEVSGKKPALEVKTVEGVLRRVPIGKGKGGDQLLQTHLRYEGTDDDESDEDDDELYEEAPVLDLEVEGTTAHSGADPKDLMTLDKDPIVENAAVSDLDYMKARVKGGDWSSDDEGNADADETNFRKESSKSESETSCSEGEEEEEEDHEEDVHMTDAPTKVVIAKEDGELKDDAGIRNHESQIRVDTGAPDGQETIVEVEAEEQESVSETGRLFVRNLPYTASEDELAAHFGRFGELSQVHVVLDKTTKRSKGLAYILYMFPEAAVRAMEELDKSIFQGRLLHILPAKRPPAAPEPKQAIHAGPGTTKYKQEREEQRKAAEASGHTQAWNPLFMRPDTIAENVARQYGMSKSEFLDPGAEDLAVRMALGETHIIAETKRSLSDEGVDVEVLEEVASGRMGKVNRSKSVILVKNLPFTTSEADLVSMFGVFGTLGRVILPPTKTLALVEFLEAGEAHRAFKTLAYKRFKHVPLYLEWAPENLLSGNGKSKVKTIEKGLGVGSNRAIVEKELVSAQDDNDVDQARSIFVKNLNFSTTESSLKKHFQKHVTEGTIRSVTIKKKLSKAGKSLSMGFGFVELDSAEAAKMFCKSLQGTVLDGHALMLQLSHNTKKSGDSDSRASAVKKVDKKESSTKIIVRNVAFEATRKDLQQLFNPFGQIKSVRLPKKFDGNHRGFAFVEFITRQEAQNAFEALQSTHLYGRHLVLERAKEGESLEDLRARTASQFFEDNGVDLDNRRPSKKRKQAALDDSHISFGQFAD